MDVIDYNFWLNPANKVIEKRLPGETVVIAHKEGQLHAAKRMGNQFVPLILSELPTKVLTDEDIQRTCDQLKGANFQLVGPLLTVLPRALGGSPLAFPKELLTNTPTLKQWFQQNQNVTELDLQNQDIGTNEIVVLTAALPSSQVRRLNLSNNQIKDEGVKALANALSRSHLIELNLSGNPLTADGINALAFALPFSLVNKLYLANCKIADDGAVALASMLLSSGLVYLDPENNQIDSPGMEALGKVLPSISYLQIGLSGNAVNAPCNVSIGEVTLEGPVHVPENCVCKITGKIMHDPVSVANGETYEREAIDEHLKTHNTSPVDKSILAHKSLTPNKDRKQKLEKLIRKHPQLEQKTYIPEASKNACLTALAQRDVVGLKNLLENDRRLLSVNFSAGQLMELACGATPELLKTVIEAYQVRPHCSHELCIKAAEGVGIEGVKLLLQLLPKSAPMSLPLVLFEALEIGSSVYLKVLLEMEVSPNSKNYEGSFALHHAVKVGNQAGIDMLMESGADSKTVDGEGRTPPELAEQLVKADLMRYIKRKKTEIKIRSFLDPIQAQNKLLQEKLSFQENRCQQLEEKLQGS